MLRSVFSNWFGLVVLGLMSFVLTPVLIHALGDFRYGLWILVTSVTDNYGLLELGMRITLQRFLARSAAEHDRGALKEFYSTALALTLVLAVIVMLLSVVFAFVLPGFFRLQGQERITFQVLVLTLGTSVGFLLPVRLLGTCLCGLQRFDLYNISAISIGLVRTILIVVALQLKFGVIGVGVVTLGTAFLSLPVHLILLHRVESALRFEWSRVSWARSKELLHFSFFMFLSSAGDRLRSYMDSFVIARVLAVALVTPFNVAGRLMEYFRLLLLAAVGPLLPRFSQLEGQGDRATLHDLFLRSIRATALLSVFVGSMLLLNGRDILSLWVGSRFADSYTLLAVLTVGYMVALGQEPCTSILVARGKHRPLGLYSLSEGLANLILSVVLAYRYGLLGVALGTAIPMIIVRTFVQPYFALRAAEVSVWDYFRRGLARPVAICALFLLGSLAGMHWLPSMWFSMRVVVQIAYFAVLLGSLGWPRSEWGEVVAALRRPSAESDPKVEASAPAAEVELASVDSGGRS